MRPYQTSATKVLARSQLSAMNIFDYIHVPWCRTPARFAHEAAAARTGALQRRRGHTIDDDAREGSEARRTTAVADITAAFCILPAHRGAYLPVSGRFPMSDVSPNAVAFPAMPPISGVRLAAYAAGIRYRGRDDVMV